MTFDVLMGCFYPFVSGSMAGDHAAGPYAAALFFVLGVALCAIPVNYLLMRMPLDGQTPAVMGEYTRAPGAWHLWRVLGGAIWCTGQWRILLHPAPTSWALQCPILSGRERR